MIYGITTALLSLLPILFWFLSFFFFFSSLLATVLAQKLKRTSMQETTPLLLVFLGAVKRLSGRAALLCDVLYNPISEFLWNRMVRMGSLGIDSLDLIWFEHVLKKKVRLGWRLFRGLFCWFMYPIFLKRPFELWTNVLSGAHVLHWLVDDEMLWAPHRDTKIWDSCFPNFEFFSFPFRLQDKAYHPRSRI